jgi:hypothetical protein
VLAAELLALQTLPSDLSPTAFPEAIQHLLAKLSKQSPSPWESPPAIIRFSGVPLGFNEVETGFQIDWRWIFPAGTVKLNQITGNFLG